MMDRRLPDRIRKPSPEALKAFIAAVTRATNDPDFLIAALNDRLAATEPISKRPALVAAARLEVVRAGGITAEEIVALIDLVLLNSLKIADVLRWSVELTQTRSFKDTMALLQWSDEELASAVEEQRIVAITVDAQSRFPEWQFTFDTPDRLLPGLGDLAKAIGRQPPWELVGAFMRTQQDSFGGWAPRSPRQWLLAGNDVQEVIDALTSSNETNDEGGRS